MKKYLKTIVKQIIEGTGSRNEHISLKAHDSLVEDCTSIDRYLLLKALKNAASEKNNIEIYSKFAVLSANSKHGPKKAFHLTLSEAYEDAGDVGKLKPEFNTFEVQELLIKYTDEITKMIG